MRRSLSRRAHRVLEKSFGRAAGHRAEVVDQMRLVVVAALERDLGPRQRSRELTSTLEAQQSRNRLRWQPDLLAEARDDPLATPAELSSQVCDRDPAMSRTEALPGPLDLAARGRAVAQPLDQRCVDELEPFRPVDLREPFGRQCV